MSVKVLDGIMGLAVGDAFGVPYEFMAREKVKKIISKEMTGAGVHNQPVGTWSDDTSLTLCLLDNLDRKPDYYKIMHSFARWYETGEYTANGRCFDIGSTTRYAIRRYESGIVPLKCGSRSISNNGNGSLMRILPIIYYFDKYKTFRLCASDLNIIHKMSALTHAHPISFIACDIYVYLGILLLNGHVLDTACEEAAESVIGYYYSQGIYNELLKEFAVIGCLREYKEDDIKSSGYVVDSLIAAIWSLINSKSYEDSIWNAVMLGNDTDTVAAIAGGLAGIYYGYEKIPDRWIRDLRNKEYIVSICQKWENK